MRFSRVQNDRYVLGFTAREADWFRRTLGCYPRVPPSYHRVTRSAPTGSTEEAQRLLDEALDGERQAQRGRVQAWLSRLQPATPSGPILLPLSAAEVEWLLQVLNDVRVGSWIRLGCPGEKRGKPARVSRENTPDMVQMDFCALLQVLLLDELNRRA